MSLSLRVIGMSDVIRRLRQAAERTPEKLERATRRGALLVEREAKRIVYAGHPEHLQGRTGHLRRSITHRMVGLRATVGTPVVYAPVHEFGATIQAKRVRNLAIPVGSLKGSPRKHRLRYRPIGDKSGLFDSAGRLQYVLQPSVRIPARPYLRPALKSQREAIRIAYINAIHELLR